MIIKISILISISKSLKSESKNQNDTESENQNDMRTRNERIVRTRKRRRE